MSPTCMIKPKQSIYQPKSKSKYLKGTTMERKQENIYIELDTKCSCPPSKLKNNNNATIQFSRRYLQCQSSMPVAILRSYIEQILPHSSMTQVSLYDSHDRLLQDSDLLRSLKQTSSSFQHIPIRFTLFNTVTSFGHCLCSSLSSIDEKSSPSSSSPTIIKQETIDRTLSTCSFAQPTLISPCLSSSPIESPHSISIVNLLTPPSSLIDEITSQFGEICPALPKKQQRYRLPKKLVSTLSSNLPLDLSLKKRPSSFDFFSSRAKWIKT